MKMMKIHIIILVIYLTISAQIKDSQACNEDRDDCESEEDILDVLQPATTATTPILSDLLSYEYDDDENENEDGDGQNNLLAVRTASATCKGKLRLKGTARLV